MDICAILDFAVFVSGNLLNWDIYPALKKLLGNMIYNVLSRISNGLTRKMSRVKVPYSVADTAVLEALVKCGYISSAVRKGRGVKRIIDIDLKYDEGGKPFIKEIKLISKPSRRVYIGYLKIKPSRHGNGRFILSTPLGIMSNHDARRKKVGGEVLFEIW